MPEETDTPVVLAEIARIASVGRAAVSNWRRRHATFPRAIGGTDANPQFSLIEVESWLLANGKLKHIGHLERLWPRFEVLGDRALSGRAIAEFGLKLLPREIEPTLAPSQDLPSAAVTLVDQAVEIACEEGARKTFDFLLGRWLETYVRQMSVTSPQLAELMVTAAMASVPVGLEAYGTVLDPACGSGELLLAAARRGWRTLLGTDIDPTSVAMTSARLGLEISKRHAMSESDDRVPRTAAGGQLPVVAVRPGDSLRTDTPSQIKANLIISAPPYNERDWGHEELATDPRWKYGVPPRTESELAWVEHVLSRLAPDGVAVLLLPPAVASRRAGRRIRSALLRAGTVRAVIALPPGIAPPYSVALHLWILQAPPEEAQDNAVQEILLCDTSAFIASPGGKPQDFDWPRLQGHIGQMLDELRSRGGRSRGPGTTKPLPSGCGIISVMTLLDEQVDLTPGRHVPLSAGEQVDLGEAWNDFKKILVELDAHSGRLSSLQFSAEPHRTVGMTSVSDLDRAEALKLRTGQPVEADVDSEDGFPGAVPVLHVRDLLLTGRPGGWLEPEAARKGVEAGLLTMAVAGDVIVAGVERAYRAWVHMGEPLIIGPQLYSMRVNSKLLDSWFLAGCLRAPANARQASTHATSSGRIDVRKLQVLQLALAEQSAYGDAFQAVARLEETLLGLHQIGTGLVTRISDQLSAGRAHVY
ncbi:N-6 DNA methylase [Micromonospora sp. NPDC048843]|uniref:HsdM family class I SAM-dependent methyltransferase n=1 Tax=Micromonospora sp. NPDC048843 TaxID=3155389 RepID=UPI0033D1A739